VAGQRQIFERGQVMKNLEGQKAPAFSLEGNDGKKHSLEDYRGNTVVLYFYPRDDTPGCTKEACGFRDLGSSLKKSGAVVLGVSKDSVDSHNKFAGKYKLPFTLLSDPKAEVMKKYGAFGKKLMYGKTVEGTIRSTVVIGPKGGSYQALVNREESRSPSGRSCKFPKDRSELAIPRPTPRAGVPGLLTRYGSKLTLAWSYYKRR
jgi:thioredoxin-dependent peroxiredoxin